MTTNDRGQDKYLISILFPSSTAEIIVYVKIRKEKINEDKNETSDAYAFEQKFVGITATKGWSGDTLGQKQGQWWRRPMEEEEELGL